MRKEGQEKLYRIKDFQSKHYANTSLVRNTGSGSLKVQHGNEASTGTERRSVSIRLRYAYLCVVKL